MLGKIKNYIISKRRNYLAKRRNQRIINEIDASKIQHLKPTIKINHEWYGSEYGGFFIHPEIVNSNSIIYSIGIGKDISFDLQCISKHYCKVFGFDPTPKSIDWIKSLGEINKFQFYPFGVDVETGTKEFYLPVNKFGVSGSLLTHDAVDEDKKIQVQMKSLIDICRELGHSEIDVLKMDIEGAEYEVLDSILNCGVKISQVLVEFHDRLFDQNEYRSKSIVKSMNEKGYVVFAASATYEEISFIRKDLFQ